MWSSSTDDGPISEVAGRRAKLEPMGASVGVRWNCPAGRGRAGREMAQATQRVNHRTMLSLRKLSSASLRARVFPNYQSQRTIEQVRVNSKLFLSTMHRPKVLITRGDVPKDGYELLREKCDLEVWNSLSPIPRSELLKKIRGVDGVYCLLTDPIDEEILDAAGPQLKVVATMSVGYNHLDVKAMITRGIRVGYTPDVLTDATSELTIALLLATSRRLLEAEKAMRAGQWQSWSPSFMCGPGLKDATIGIVGLGRLGSRVAEYLNVFRVSKILYTSRSDKPEAVKFGGERVSIDRLLSESDFVVVTTALTPDTREMFDGRAFAKMKKTAIFINVSRGEVVDQVALIDALKNGTIRAAGLDVMTPEPIPLDSELLKLDNCVVIPHLGSATHETRREMALITAKNILAVLNGEPEKMPAELVI